jgi:hypothetical protein
MTCRNRDIRELLPAHLERKLDQAARKSVEQHLASCGDCRTELEILRLLAVEAVPDPGEAFWAALPGRVYREVLEQKKQPRGLMGVLGSLIQPRWAWATAVVIMTVASVWLLTRPVPMHIAGIATPDNGSPYEEMLVAESIDVEDLSTADLESIDAWASRELAALLDAAADLPSNGQDLSIDDKIAELNTQELEQLSKKLDEYKEEG